MQFAGSAGGSVVTAGETGVQLLLAEAGGGNCVGAEYLCGIIQPLPCQRGLLWAGLEYGGECMEDPPNWPMAISEQFSYNL